LRRAEDAIAFSLAVLFHNRVETGKNDVMNRLATKEAIGWLESAWNSGGLPLGERMESWKRSELDIRGYPSELKERAVRHGP